MTKIFSLENVKMVLRTIRDRGLLNTLRYVYYDFLFDVRYGTDTINTVDLDELDIDGDNIEEAHFTSR